MIKVLKQGLSFLMVSGIGFILDFSIYYALTDFLEINIVYANIISAIPAVTYVFLISTRKIFATKKSNRSISDKYIIYFIYQIILLILISLLAQFLYNKFYHLASNYLVIKNNFKIIIKCIITPITMTCNFFVMKILCEKI